MKLHDPRGIWVKVDGVTTADDALAAVDAGVSAVGMIFAPSPRRVTPEDAKAVRDAIPEDVAAFGVFDDSHPRDIAEIVTTLRLGGVQFPAHVVAGQHLAEDLIVLRTVRVRDAEDLVGIERLACDAVHFDAYVAGQLGGTGVLAPWDVIEANRPTVPFVISGGLRPDNVGEAVHRLRPHGVDVSSGVEIAPGVKDAAAMRAFVQRARTST